MVATDGFVLWPYEKLSCCCSWSWKFCLLPGKENRFPTTQKVFVCTLSWHTCAVMTHKQIFYLWQNCSAKPLVVRAKKSTPHYYRPKGHSNYCIKHLALMQAVTYVFRRRLGALAQCRACFRRQGSATRTR